MALIKPFAGLRPAPGRAAEVLAPPYDVLSSAEARERSRGRPWSFLHISKPEIDLPENLSPYDPAVYAKGRENLDRMLEQGVLLRDPLPCYYAYRLQMGTHVQTGLVAAASVPAYDENLIRKHEYTRPDKEDDRVRQIDALDAQTGPVKLTHRSNPRLRELLQPVVAGQPEVDVSTGDGVRHTLWVIGERSRIDQISALFDPQQGGEIGTLYIADGHHRSAAASRVAAQRRRAGSGWSAECEGFLAVLFQSDEVRILDYNRVVRDLNGLGPEAFLERVRERFAVAPSDEPVRPQRSGEFGMYLPGQWYRLTLDGARMQALDPVASLDVSLLAAQLVEPVLGIHDPRRDQRIDFVGGIRGLAELARRVDDGGMAVAFSLFPTRLEQLMTVADAGQVMPPKSTWFEPKLADGMVSYPLCSGLGR
ncbi:MAG TPA: DUF1015 family protein [Gammaproteobacteria bacterium]